jgi:hypothetical protein
MTHVIYDILFLRPLCAGKINTFVINVLAQLHPERQRNENQI